MSLEQTAGNFVTAASDGERSPDELKSQAAALAQRTARAAPAERDRALQVVGEGLARTHPDHQALVALTCGTLVELGANPAIAAGPTLGPLRGMLEKVRELGQACQAEVASVDEDDRAERLDELIRQRLTERPEYATVWNALEGFWRAAIAVLSRSAELRRQYRGLRELAQSVAEFEQAGHWLAQMLTVLDDEPILAIEPSNRRGLEGRIGGIVDNFQLQTLLMDAFTPRKWHERFTGGGTLRRAARIARGEGPQQTNETMCGRWNMYTWQALDAEGRLPQSFDTPQHWIWNEGTPADIPLFEGRRAILLGPPAYPRFWGVQRAFAALKGDLQITHWLTGEQIDDWTTRMAQARKDA